MGSQEAVDPVRHQFLRHTRITVVRTVEIKALRLRFCQACIRSYTLDRMICLCSRYGAKASLDAQSMMVGSPPIKIEDSGGQLWASGGATNGFAWPVYFRLRKNPSHSAQASAGMTTSHTPTDSLRDRQQHQTGMTFSRLFQ